MIGLVDNAGHLIFSQVTLSPIEQYGLLFFQVFQVIIFKEMPRMLSIVGKYPNKLHPAFTTDITQNHHFVALKSIIIRVRFKTEL